MSVKISITVSVLYASIIRECREGKGISQAKIAESVGVSPSMWSRIEGGDSPLTVEYLRAAADAMSVKISRIFLLAEHLEEDILPNFGISISKLGSEDKNDLDSSNKEGESSKTAVQAASVAAILPILAAVVAGSLPAMVATATASAMAISSIFSISGKDFSKVIGLKNLVAEFIYTDK